MNGSADALAFGVEHQRAVGIETGGQVLAGAERTAIRHRDGEDLGGAALAGKAEGFAAQLFDNFDGQRKAGSTPAFEDVGAQAKGHIGALQKRRCGGQRR